MENKHRSCCVEVWGIHIDHIVLKCGGMYIDHIVLMCGGIHIDHIVLKCGEYT